MVLILSNCKTSDFSPKRNKGDFPIASSASYPVILVNAEFTKSMFGIEFSSRVMPVIIMASLDCVITVSNKRRRCSSSFSLVTS